MNLSGSFYKVNTMAKNIFTIRHGEASHQVNPNIWETYSNEEIPLTSLGRSQASECGRFFADMQINPETTLIISSPFRRSLQTGEIIASKIPSLQVITDPSLVEQDFGMFTGLTTEQCYEKYPSLARLYDFHAEKDGDYKVKPPKGESKEDVVKRVEQFMENISAWFQNSKYDNLIIVSHCVVNQAISKVLNKETPEWFLGLNQLPNCSIQQFSQSNDKWIDKGLVFVPKEQGANITLACPEHLKGKGAEHE